MNGTDTIARAMFPPEGLGRVATDWAVYTEAIRAACSHKIFCDGKPCGGAILDCDSAVLWEKEDGTHVGVTCVECYEAVKDSIPTGIVAIDARELRRIGHVTGLKTIPQAKYRKTRKRNRKTTRRNP